MLLRNDKSYNGVSSPLQSLAVTTCTNGHPSDRNLFARLPRDPRDQIYEYALGTDIRLLNFGVMKILMTPLGVADPRDCGMKDGLPIWMLSSKAILSEALAVCHRTRRFKHLDLPRTHASKKAPVPTRTNPLVLNEGIRYIELYWSLEVAGHSFPSPGSWHPNYNEAFLNCVARWSPSELDVYCTVLSDHPEGPCMEHKSIPYGYRRYPAPKPNTLDRFKQLHGRCTSISVQVRVPNGKSNYLRFEGGPKPWTKPIMERKRQHLAVLCQSIEAWAREMIGGSTSCLLKDESDCQYLRVICEAKRVT